MQPPPWAGAPLGWGQPSPRTQGSPPLLSGGSRAELTTLQLYRRPLLTFVYYFKTLDKHITP